jgi:tetratricopeptide (TPR) repeat protein
MPTSGAGELAAVAGEEVLVAGLEGEAASSKGSGGNGTSDESAKEPPRPSSRFIAIAIVSATLAAALVGFLFNHASSAAQRASDQAQEISLQASREQTSSYQSAEDDYYNYLLQQADQAKATQSYFEATLQGPNPQQWVDLEKVTDSLATREGKTLPKDMHPDEANGPNPDFPDSFFAARTEPSVKLTSLANGYNDIGGQWGKLGSTFSAILTMLAISLLLLGSSLALYGSSRMLFASLGVVLVVIAVVWGATAAVSGPGTQPTVQAASSYARGVTEFADSTTPSTYRPALEAFTKAIRLRPDYALAYDQRAETEDYMGSSNPYAAGTDIVSVPWLTKAVADERTAYGLGLRSEDELIDFGTDSLDLWARQGARGGFPSEAFAADQQLTAIDSTNPVGWTELGLADLAEGQLQQGRTAFGVAAENILYSDVGAKTLRPSHAFADQQDWVGKAMVQLDELAGADAALRSTAVGLEGLIAGSVSAGHVEDPDRLVRPLHARATSFQLLPSTVGVDVTPSASWDPSKGGIDLTRGNVMTVWYQRPVRHGQGAGPWNVIADSIQWGNKEQFPLGSPAGCGHGAYCESQNVLTDTSQCVVNAQYRADIFYKGVRVLSLRQRRPTTDFGHPVARVDPQMNIGTCIPSSWRLKTTLTAKTPIFGTTTTITHALSGVVMSYVAPHNTYGYDMLRIYPDRGAFSGDDTTFSEEVVQYAVNLFAGKSLPADVTEDNLLTDDGFMGLQNAVLAVYNSPSANVTAYVGAGISDDDAVIVGVEYGPKKWMASKEGFNLFYSASLLDYG